MKKYEIAVNDLITTAEGWNEQEALENHAQDAGYSSYATLLEEHPDEPSVKELEDIQAAPREDGYICGPEFETPALKIAEWDQKGEDLKHYYLELFRAYNYEQGGKRYFMKFWLNDAPGYEKPAHEITAEQAEIMQAITDDEKAFDTAIRLLF